MDLPTADDGAILVVGPTLSGRRQLFHHLVEESVGRPVLVSTREPAENIRSRHDRVTHSEGQTPLVIDCITNALGRSKDETETVKYAQAPQNLTSIGVNFTDLIEQYKTERLTVGLTSLSPLLVYSSSTDVFQFLHLIVQQAIGNDWPVIASIDPRIHQPATIEQFVPLFDHVFETRRTAAGDHEYRRRNPGHTEWEAF